MYVHVPFCRRRCRYCDFAVAIRGPDAGFVDDVAREIGARLETGELSETFQARTIFLGGGTPSYLADAEIARLIGLVAREPSSEVTIEANPEDLDPARVLRWAEAGVRRVSVGLQSLDDAVLAHLGRGHRADDARRRIATIVKEAPVQVSVDLIFGDPVETDASWRATLEGALALGVGHVSAYALTIEEGSLMRSLRLDEEALARRYEVADEVLSRAGLDWYEVSNWARPGEACAHNRAYWSGVPYVGLGPSAHSYAAPVRSWNVASWPRWRDRVRAGLVPTEGLEVLTEEEVRTERLYLALRQRDGIPAGLVPAWAAEFFEDAGAGRRRLGLQGRLLLDELAARLAAEGVHLRGEAIAEAAPCGAGG